MRSKTATWFECRIAFEKVMEDGMQKRVTEKYVVNAMTHTEAEAYITEEMSQYISGEFEVKSIVPAQYKEVFFMNEGEKMLANQTEDLMHAVKKHDREEGMKVYDRKLEDYPTDARWYKAKVQFITIDEKSEKEKRSNVIYLVQACSVHNACDNIDNTMKGSMVDYDIVSVAEQPIIDVFELTVAQQKGVELMDRMAEELKDRSKTVEEIADKYVKTATPELRQQLIDKLTAMRENGEIPNENKA